MVRLDEFLTNSITSIKGNPLLIVINKFTKHPDENHFCFFYNLTFHIYIGFKDMVAQRICLVSRKSF